jgi:hypothetical protein
MNDSKLNFLPTNLRANLAYHTMREVNILKLPLLLYKCGLRSLTTLCKSKRSLAVIIMYFMRFGNRNILRNENAEFGQRIMMDCREPGRVDISSVAFVNVQRMLTSYLALFLHVVNFFLADVRWRKYISRHYEVQQRGEKYHHPIPRLRFPTSCLNTLFDCLAQFVNYSSEKSRL